MWPHMSTEPYPEESRKSTACMRVLLEAGADPTVEYVEWDVYRSSAFHSALIYGTGVSGLFGLPSHC